MIVAGLIVSLFVGVAVGWYLKGKFGAKVAAVKHAVDA